jgi:hypothetical protein
VTDERGHSESLRRFTAKVAAPDGSTTTLPLDAVGAGLYSASLPVARPGAYVASLVDDQTRTLEATAGAVLALGDELRPTGTDRGLLRRIAEQSGGKERDTLAGIFQDRDAQRFAYTSLTPLLIALAAFALLFSVGARRLTIPEPLERAWHALFSARKERILAPRHGAGDGAISALSRVRQRKVRAGVDETPPSVPRFSRPAITVPAPATSPSPVIRAETTNRTTPVPSEVGVSRPPTAAEILLARRRGRRS